MADIDKFCSILRTLPDDMSIADLLLYLREKGYLIPGITESDEILLPPEKEPVDSYDSP